MSSYATPTDLQALSLPAAALTGISAADQQKALDAASSLADGYLSSRFTLPLTAWGDDFRRAVCNIGAYDLLTRRGYNPDAGDNSSIRDRYDDALRWLERISGGLVNPVGVTDSASGQAGGTNGAFVLQPQAGKSEDGSFTVSAPRGRGW